MSTRAFCLARRKTEIPTFTKVLKAVPQGRQEYRPEPKSRSAAELATLLAAEEAALVSLLDTGTVQWKNQPPGARLADIVASYERDARAVNDRLERLDETGWTKQGRFLMEGAPPWEDTIENFVWGMFFDAIHHRGQLTTYLRPMGGKVPAIYGPSADDPGGP
ncbi:MAG: hypothetical protein AUH06_01770 [Gemmatimonadetes bacterium 13_2_20CM_69_27]|nr:MAG: hypothetical protein AUH06_01770 [Gemmatimonadetes bacterium 13_2_20CM_69_27]OLB59827.1 MAG: hypothetical protein AUI13_02395 [Gemmatimonadetes bacterium 13_2_20CM_2_69_23]OLD58505.1 MAG: hypothetical protein AUF60_09530 [Gemmatimonadetes bacterium 13_1_20CM_69_28]PYO31799.1 MAG: hypothetical protein DMD32_07470 [Gemmatimonadota bacterium]